MTKQDYIIIAEVIKKVGSHFVFHEESVSEEVRAVMIHDFSSALLKDNPAFNVTRFRKEVYRR